MPQAEIMIIMIYLHTVPVTVTVNSVSWRQHHDQSVIPPGRSTLPVSESAVADPPLTSVPAGRRSQYH